MEGEKRGMKKLESGRKGEEEEEERQFLTDLPLLDKVGHHVVDHQRFEFLPGSQATTREEGGDRKSKQKQKGGE